MSRNSEDGVAIRASGVEQTFGDVNVLSDVDLTVDRGEIAAVVGPNGSGKSTLLRMLAGLDGPVTGDVEVPTDGGVRNVGFLPQQPAFRQGFTAHDTLAFYASLLPEVGSDAVTDTLDRVGLAGVSDRAVGSLSGGMIRLLGLGRAVLGDPAVLILDEPGSGLDPAMVERLFGVVRTLSTGGTGVVVASHELAAVQTHADTVSVLDGGGFVASGSPDALLAETGTGSLSEAFLGVVRGEAGESTVRSGADTDADGDGRRSTRDSQTTGVDGDE